MKVELRNLVILLNKEEDYKISYFKKRDGVDILGNSSFDYDNFIMEVEKHKNSSGYTAFKFRKELSKEISRYKRIGFVDITTN